MFDTEWDTGDAVVAQSVTIRDADGHVIMQIGPDPAIRIYDTSGNLIGKWDAVDFRLIDVASGDLVVLNYFTGVTFPGSDTAPVGFPAVFGVAETGPSNRQTFVALDSGAYSPGGASQVVAYSESFDGSQAAQIHVTHGLQVNQPGAPGVVETWHPLSIQSPFTGSVQYRFMGDNTVFVTGRIGLPNPAPNFNDLIGTLPAGYRPSRQFVIGVATDSVGGMALLFNTDGTIRCGGNARANDGAYPAHSFPVI